jgi:hypothetical protein
MAGISQAWAPLFLITKRRALQNLLDQGAIEQTLKLGSSFCELGSFGVDGIMEEHNELTIALDNVREITLCMGFDKIFLVGESTFGMVHVVRPKSVFAMLDEGLLNEKEERSLAFA